MNGDKKGKWDESKILKIAKNIYDFGGDDSSPKSYYPAASSYEDKAAGDARLRNLQADGLNSILTKNVGNTFP